MKLEKSSVSSGSVNKLGVKSSRVNRSLSDGLGKLPPQVLDLEKGVLGALMLEKDALTTVIDILKPESFYTDQHKEIYHAIQELFKNSEPIDMLTVTTQLRKDGKLEFVGGAYYVAELTKGVNSSANIEFHARIVSEMAIKRELIRISSEIQKDAYEDTTDAFELLDRMEQSLFEVSESNIKKNYDSMRTLMGHAIKELENRKHHKDGLTGIPSGFIALDRVTSGWQNSDLVIIASRPGMGKTAFIVTALRNAAIDHDKPVAIFSLEMSSIQLVNRLISAEAGLENEKIKKGNLKNYEWEQLVHKTNKLTNAPIFIDDTPALSILELRAKCRRLKSQHDIELIVIDYLQLMSGDNAKGMKNREQEIASISRALKGIAKELAVPVIALSQLSRAVEIRGGDKRPQLSDLRESGSIEQDADMVMFLYRPEYYERMEDENNLPTKGVAEVIIAKHRNGSLETVPLKFISKFTKFTDLDAVDITAGFSNLGIPREFDSDSGTITMGSKLNGGKDTPPDTNFDNDEKDEKDFPF